MTGLIADRIQSTRARMFAGLFLFAFFVTFCVSPTGYLAVRTACQKDGGYTITSTTYVAGYAVEQGYSPLCVTCLLDVRDGNFKYVDFMASENSRSDVESFAYQRYFTSKDDDPACSKVRESPRAQTFIRGADLADDRCIAVRVIDKPSSHVYVRRNRTLKSNLGAQFNVNEHLIFNQETGVELAAFRRYSHLPVLVRELTSAAVPLYECDHENPPFSSAGFRLSVLRDENMLRNE